MFGFQLNEAPVPLGKYLHDGDIITFRKHNTGSNPCTGTLSRKPCLLLAGLTTVCFRAMCCFREARTADLAGGNFDELKEHICSRLFVLPNETIVYPGHGAPTTIGIEKAGNPFFR